MDTPLIHSLPQDVDCWYDLLLGKYGLYITMPRGTWDEISSYLIEPRVRGDGTGLARYVAPVSQRWGFDTCATLDLEPTLVTARFPFPKVMKPGGFFDNRDLQRLSSYSATIGALTSALYLASRPSPWTDRRQLVAITGVLISQRMGHGGAVGARLSNAAVAWIKAQPPTAHHPFIERAMASAYERITKQRFGVRDVARQFQANIDQSGRLILQVPGNACDLGPEHARDNYECGYELSPHNADTPIQQITFLTGLAALNTFARSNPIT